MGFLVWTTTRLAAVLLAGLVLGSCTVEVGQPIPPGPGLGPGFCTREFNPVCAERRGVRQTFNNSCLAAQSGARIVHRGACQSGSARPPQFCTNEFSPVCAIRGNEIRTFGNACRAEASRYRILHRGQCRSSSWTGGGGGTPGGQRFCTLQYDPVCGRRGNTVRTFGNRCEADAAGFRVIARGRC